MGVAILVPEGQIVVALTPLKVIVVVAGIIVGWVVVVGIVVGGVVVGGVVVAWLVSAVAAAVVVVSTDQEVLTTNESFAPIPLV